MLKCGLLFPGQGSQYAGMGRDIYEESSETADVMHMAEDILGYRISKVIFSGTEDELTDTAVSQLAMFIVSMMYYKQWQSEHPDETMTVAAGHSLGEYSALCASGVLSFSDALSAIKKRGELMKEYCDPSQGMYALIGIGEDEVRKDISAGRLKAEIANINSSSQVVVAGLKDDISSYNKKKVELAVAGAFHSKYMHEANERFQDVLDGLEFGEPSCIFISNSTGMPAAGADEVKQNLKKQMVSPVKWLSTVRAVKETGVERMREIGPGDTLKKLAATIVFKPRCM